MARKKKIHRLHYFVLPHPKTHKKAHLLSHHALVISIVFVLLLQMVLSSITGIKPQVLSATTHISHQDLLTLTNQQREKFGQADLTEDEKLDKAAEEKAQYMFANQFWAHNAPDGTTPWVFIKNAGYDYVYAGENLARGFTTTQDTIDAWMASKMGHKENLLSPNYQNVGFGIAEGTLKGEKTILVVQMFGSSESGAIKAPLAKANTPGAPIKGIISDAPASVKGAINTESASPLLFAGITNNPLAITKSVGYGIIFIFTFLIILDVMILTKRKAKVAVHSRHILHIIMIPITVVFLFMITSGAIL